LVIASCTTLGAQVEIHFARQPVSIAGALVAPGKMPSGVAIWQVTARNAGTAPYSLDHATVMHVAARCVAVVPSQIALAVARQSRMASRAGRGWRIAATLAEAASLTVPVLQGAGKIRGTPLISVGAVAAGLLTRIATSESAKLDSIVAPGTWLQEGSQTAIDPGRAALFLMIGGVELRRFAARLGPSFEIPPTGPWSCQYPSGP
jgi:hypothetical protein